MSVLGVKLRRDLRRRPGPLVAVFLLVLLGVGLYGASYDAYRNLQDSYESIFVRDRFADLTVSGGDTASIATGVAAAPGVAVTTARTVVDVPLRLPDGSTRVGRLVGMPVAGRPAVDRVRVERGSPLAPGPRTLVLAESHLADSGDLEPGSRVRVFYGNAWHRLRVRGVAASPEYLWPAPSRQEVLPAPGSFGVLFVPEALAAEAASPGPSPNQVLAYYTPAGRERGTALDGELTSLARADGALDVQTRAEQPSHAALQEDIDGFAEMALLFPLLFLTAAGLATYVVLTRQVARDRTVIGMMRANGFRRRTVLGHYLVAGLLVGGLGAVAGVALGLVAADVVTRLYTQAVGVPAAVVAVHATTVVGGLAFGLVAGGLSALAPALAAARVPPAEAMRGVAPVTTGGRGLLAAAERVLPATRRLPAGVWLVLRGPARQPRRTLYTEIGVVLALVLVLVSWGMIDTMRSMLARQYDDVQRQDAEVTLAGPAGPRALRRLGDLPSVTRVEPAAQQPVSLRHGDAGYATALVGLRPRTTMHGFATPDGGWRHLPARGVLLGVAMQDRLGVEVGDRVKVAAPGEEPRNASVAGFVDEPLGSLAYASLSETARLSGGARPHTALLTLAPGVDRDRVRQHVEALPGVVVYKDSQGLRRTAEDLLDLFYVFVGVMLVFGGLLAFTVLFATMSVNLAERAPEVAALRAAGLARGRLYRLVMAENLLLVLVGIVPGLILGRLATAGFMGSFDSDLFRMNTEIWWSTYLLSALAVVVVALLAQVPGLRALGRLDLAAVVRQRAT